MRRRWPRNCRPWKPAVGSDTALTVDAVWSLARGLGVQRLDAQLLLGAVLNRDRAWLLAHGEYVLTHEEDSTVRALLEQRAAGVPVAYLLGQREFHGLMLRVTPDVLDPRPDTETLVEWALALMAPLAPDASSRTAFSAFRVLDLGTGSGAIALALKSACPWSEVHATDASAAALAVARDNSAQLRVPVNFHLGSWWEAVRGLHFDLIVSNPPYIREGDPHLPALAHEPRAALVAAEDGLADLRAIIDGAHRHLTAGGWLLLEHGHDQATDVAAMLQAAGFVEFGHRLDLAGHTRCTGGRLPR